MCGSSPFTPRPPSPRRSRRRSKLPRQRLPPLRKPLLPHTRLPSKPLARSEEDIFSNKSSGGAEPTDEAYFAALPLCEVGDWVRVLPVTAPGSLPRLATGFPEATVVAYDAHKGEYTVKPSVMCSRQQTKIPCCAVVAVSRDGNAELKTRGGLLSSEGAKAGVQAERSTPINLLGLLKSVIC